MFLMNYTRSEIALVISRLSHDTHNPSKEHWHTLFRLLKYLRATIGWCLHFNKFPAVLKDFMMQTGFLIMMKLVY